MHIVIDAHLAVKEIDGVSRYLNGLLAELPKIDSSVQYTILSLPREKSCLPEEVFSFGAQTGNFIYLCIESGNFRQIKRITVLKFQKIVSYLSEIND